MRRCGTAGPVSDSLCRSFGRGKPDPRTDGDADYLDLDTRADQIPYPGPPIPPGTLTIELGVDPHNLYEQTRLVVPADTPFVIAFDNRDVYLSTAATGGVAGRAHNVAIRLGDVLLFNPLPATRAPAKANYFFPEGLRRATYRFSRVVIPQMTGSLIVE